MLFSGPEDLNPIVGDVTVDRLKKRRENAGMKILDMKLQDMKMTDHISQS